HAYGPDDLGARLRILYQGAEYRGRARTTTWDGSVGLDGNAIMRGRMINNWNLDRGLSIESPAKASWKAVTTGNYGAVDLWLVEEGGRLALVTPHVTAELDIGDIGFEPIVFDAG